MSFYVDLPTRGVLAAWREAARRAISHRIPPDAVQWSGSDDLFERAPLPANAGAHSLRVPQAFMRLLSSVIWHSAPERFDLLYRALWRLDTDDGAPLSQADALGRRLHLMAKAVGRDIHKMHAFVRFRETQPRGKRRSFGAWFEPEHNTLEPGAEFFVKRFADMDWVIATPRLTARFEDGSLTFDEGMPAPHLPADASEELWATYFANIFNPARIKLQAMRAEMPKKYWKNLPETRLIPSLLADAEDRVRRMHAAGASIPRPGAAPVSTRYRASLPEAPTLPASMDEAREAARQCRRCSLCEPATQTVWGTGAPNAALMIVGEQPGDHEDLSGLPFIGAAGQMLRTIMSEVGLSPEEVWLTNAVKHFKFTPRGKRRMHQSPNRDEITRCRWWVGLELAFVQPRLTLALGASAALSLTGDSTPLLGRRGTIETGLHGGPVLISWHPSYILRTPHREDQARLRQELAQDLQAALAHARASDRATAREGKSSLGPSDL